MAGHRAGSRKRASVHDLPVDTAPLDEVLQAVAEFITRARRHAPERDLARPAGGVELEGHGERGQARAVDPDGAGDRVAADLIDEIGSSHDDSRLRPAKQFVAGEHDDVGAVLDRLPHRRLGRRPCGRRSVEPRHAGVEETRADVRHEGATVRRGQFGKLPVSDLLGESLDAVVRGMDLEHDGGALVEGALVVGGTRAVRGADLDEVCP